MKQIKRSKKCKMKAFQHRREVSMERVKKIVSGTDRQSRRGAALASLWSKPETT
jgi:hypothetical protein